MDFLTLNQVKDQLRIERDFELEDSKLTDIANGAEQTVANYCRRTYEDFIDEYGVIPQPIINAALMLCAVGYQNDSPVTIAHMSAVPYTFDLLVKPYMRLGSCDGGGEGWQYVTLGSDVKILIEATLPDDLKMADVDFSGKVVNMSQKDKEVAFSKSDCLETEDGGYVLLLDTEQTGIGTLMLRVTFQIPDTDYPSGFRKEVVKINPKIRVTG